MQGCVVVNDSDIMLLSILMLFTDALLSFSLSLSLSLRACVCAYAHLHTTVWVKIKTSPCITCHNRICIVLKQVHNLCYV